MNTVGHYAWEEKQVDITSLYNISSNAIKSVADKTSIAQSASADDNGNMFSSVLSSAMDSLNTTNSYISDAENEKIKLALGESENTHDLTVALQKASAALQYTVAVRDKFLEAYKEIMQIQI